MLALAVAHFGALWFPLSLLDHVLLHCHGTIDAVQLVVQPTGVANGLTALIPAPQGRLGRSAVGALETCSSRCTLNGQTERTCD